MNIGDIHFLKGVAYSAACASRRLADAGASLTLSRADTDGAQRLALLIDEARAQADAIFATATAMACTDVAMTDAQRKQHDEQRRELQNSRDRAARRRATRGGEEQ